MRKIIASVFIVLLATGCQTSKRVVYVQDAGTLVTYNDSTVNAIPDVTLKVGDLFTITVNANTPEAAQPFNLPLLPGQSGLQSYNQGAANISMYGGSGSLQNYLVDTNGDIMFPIIGKIHVAGMTKSQLSAYIREQIYPRYINEEPIITIRYANFKVSVLGEVSRPGVLRIDNEMISIFEAVAMAGDMTIYGRRDNVLLIRESNGKRESLRLDLRDKRLVASPYFYLQQNDILYVQPNTPRSRSSALSTAETLSVSIVGTLISLTSLIVTLMKK